MDLFDFVPRRNLSVIDSAMDNKLIDDMNRELLRPSSRDEVYKVAFQMGAWKLPGLDGYSGIFYHQYWHILGEDLFLTVRGFFNSGFLLKELNHTDIVLIPKVPNPESVSQLRPISLCNFTYKIISRSLWLEWSLSLGTSLLQIRVLSSLLQIRGSLQFWSLDQRWVHIVMQCVTTVS